MEKTNTDIFDVDKECSSLWISMILLLKVIQDDFLPHTPLGPFMHLHFTKMLDIVLYSVKRAFT